MDLRNYVTSASKREKRFIMAKKKTKIAKSCIKMLANWASLQKQSKSNIPEELMEPEAIHDFFFLKVASQTGVDTETLPTFL